MIFQTRRGHQDATRVANVKIMISPVVDTIRFTSVSYGPRLGNTSFYWHCTSPSHPLSCGDMSGYCGETGQRTSACVELCRSLCVSGSMVPYAMRNGIISLHALGCVLSVQSPPAAVARPPG